MLDDDALLPAPCRVCGATYDKYGDGWDGMCPSCADNADNYPLDLDGDVRARAADEEAEREYRARRLSHVATACSLISLLLFAYAIALALSQH